MVDRNFSGEFARLFRLAMKIAQTTRVALEKASVRDALRELLLAFPTYRTYGTAAGMSAADINLLERVAEKVKNRPEPPESAALDFVVCILTGGLTAAAYDDAAEFRTRFQQLTGPLMAKSVEDTLFFRQNMGLALNEVGAEPVKRAFSLTRFHREMQIRLTQQPDALSGTSTHDTKRGEDARARLYTLTEAPDIWRDGFGRWRQMNQTHVKFLNDGTAPKAADTWMLYQALAGVWPASCQIPDAAALASLEARFLAFVEKALREAKLRTDWVDTNEAYETAVLDYARYLFSPENSRFLTDFHQTLQPFIRGGLINSLTQTVIKLTAPGVPDIYQGSETLNFSLVDPDNRREPDFPLLAKQLDGPEPFSADEHWRTGRVNQFVTAGLLGLRQRVPALFRRGAYLPLQAVGQYADNVIAFARTHDESAAIVIAPRLVFSVADKPLAEAAAEQWQETVLELPARLAGKHYRELFSGEICAAGERLALSTLPGRAVVLVAV